VIFNDHKFKFDKELSELDDSFANCKNNCKDKNKHNAYEDLVKGLILEK